MFPSGYTTARLLKLIMDNTTHEDEENNSAPNLISELSYELLLDDNYSEQEADKISDLIFELTSALVKEPGYYK